MKSISLQDQALAWFCPTGKLKEGAALAAQGLHAPSECRTSSFKTEPSRGRYLRPLCYLQVSTSAGFSPAPPSSLSPLGTLGVLLGTCRLPHQSQGEDLARNAAQGDLSIGTEHTLRKQLRISKDAKI